MTDGDVPQVQVILPQKHMLFVTIQELVHHLRRQYVLKWEQNLQRLNVSQEKCVLVADVVSYQEQHTIMLFSLRLQEHLMGMELQQMMALSVRQVPQELILRLMLCVLLKHQIIHEPALPVLKISIIQSRLMVMSKTTQQVLPNFVLRNDSRQPQLFRVILLVQEKWDGMVPLG